MVRKVALTAAAVIFAAAVPFVGSAGAADPGGTVGIFQEEEPTNGGQPGAGFLPVNFPFGQDGFFPPPFTEGFFGGNAPPPFIAGFFSGLSAPPFQAGFLPPPFAAFFGPQSEEPAPATSLSRFGR
jgi:hypothetical protein